MKEIQPLISFSEEGQPLVLKHALPEPTQYEFTHLARLGINSSSFKKLPGTGTSENTFKSVNITAGTVVVEDFKKELVIKIRFQRPTLAMETSSAPKSDEKILSSVIGLDYVELVAKVKSKLVPVLIKNKSGSFSIDYRAITSGPIPEKTDIYLVSTLKMSNFLGNYGAAKIIQTMSLLPGERTELYVRTYKDESSKTIESSSIIDSYSVEGEDEFSKQLQTETTKDKSLDIGAEAEFHADGPIGGSVSASLDASMQKSSRVFSDSIAKHTSKTSSKRDVTINTSSEYSVTEGTENSIKRTIQNPNSDRVVTYVFRQMNQEYYTVLHLTDIKVCFYNGIEETRKIVDIDQIDLLLDYCMESSQVDLKNKTKNDIYAAVNGLKDYKKRVQTDMLVKLSDKISSFNYDKKTNLEELPYNVDGLILNIKKIIMRTEGIIIDALISPTSTLRQETLQEEQHKLKELATRNAILEAELEIRKKIIEVLKTQTFSKPEDLTSILSGLKY